MLQAPTLIGSVIERGAFAPVARSIAAPPPMAGRAMPGLYDHERATLHGASWFSELPSPLRIAILGSARVSQVEAGALLAHRGDKASVWMGVASGALRLDTALRDGRGFTLDFVGPGHWVGDIALIDDRPHDLDVTAHVRSKLLFVSKPDLRRLIADYDELGNGLLQLNCRRLRHMFRRFEELQSLPLPQRLACQLQRLAHQFGRTVDEGISIDLALSQSDIAAVVGGSRQRINRALRQLHLEGIVGLGEPRVLVRDAARLEAVADGRLLLPEHGASSSA